MDDFYAQLKEEASRLRRDDFVAWLKHPTLILEFVDEHRGDPSAGPALAMIEATVLFQQASTVGTTALSDDGASDVRGARVLAKNGRALEASEELSLGRSSDCDIVIDHRSLSKVHAYITREPNGSFLIRDAGSRNGITINGRRVPAEQSAKLKPDDVVRIGAVMVRLMYPRPLYELLTQPRASKPAASYLRDRTFAAFWAGQALSLLADASLRLVMTMWVVASAATGTAPGPLLSAIGIFTIVPMMITLLGGGVLIDRMARSRVLLMSVALKAVAIAVVSVLLRHNSLEIWHIFAVAVVLGVADAFFMPALTATVPELVRREDLGGANALVMLSAHVANFAGPAIGTALVAFGGYTLALSIVTILYLISGLFLIRLPGTKQRYSTHDQDRAATGGLREAARFMFGEPRLWMTSLSFRVCESFSFVAASVLLPLLIKEALHRSISNLGPVTSVYWLGALLGTLWMGKKIFKRELAGYAAAPIIGLCLVAAGLPIMIYGVALVWFVRGFATSVLNLTWIGTIQRLAPLDMIGRVASIDAFIGAALVLGSFAVAGAVVNLVRIDAIFLFIGAASLVVPALAYTNRRFRHFERTADTEFD